MLVVEFGKCSHGADLLLNDNAMKVLKLLVSLKKYNSDRKRIEKELLNTALNTVDKSSEDPIIVLQGESWHEGIIGIIASRIKYF